MCPISTSTSRPSARTPTSADYIVSSRRLRKDGLSSAALRWTRASSELLSDVTGAILAGGLGTRLRSVVSDRPKVLAVVREALAHLLDQLQDAGVAHVVLLTGYRGEQVRDEFGDSYRGLSLDYSFETEPLGTAGALRLALPKLFAAPTTSRAGQTASLSRASSFSMAIPTARPT